MPILRRLNEVMAMSKFSIQRVLFRASITFGSIAICVLFIGLPGCSSYYRLNHWHSDANQKLAQDALDQLTSETDRRKGQLATELRNLDALTAFERIGAQHRL